MAEQPAPGQLEASPAPPPDFSDVEFPPLLEEGLNPAWDLGVAAQHIVLTHFREMLRRRKGVWRNDDDEDVHQIRVAARRCRTALQTFAALWDDKQARKFGDYLARFAEAFNVARDIDVMLIWLREQLESADEDHAAGYRWLLERNTAKRQAEQHRLEKALAKLERDGLPAAFVSYFSHLPLDLWELHPPGPAAPAEQAAPPADPEAHDG
jgi:CHAD domain-containing protein